ncbi:MAG: hypothetical protein V3U65_13545 [Granulosicoccaceae bacterium]
MIRIIKIAICALSISSVGVVLTGCNAFKVKPAGSNVVAASQAQANKSDELIAIDLVNALVQFKGMHPSVAQLSMTPPTTGFSSALQAVLSAAGYSLSGQVQQNAHKVTSVTTLGATEKTGHHRTYILSVGEIKIKRDYFLQDRGVTPSSNLYIQGADASQIVLHDNLFNESTVPLVADSAPVTPVQAEPVAVIDAPASTTPDAVATTLPLPSTQPAASRPSRDLLVQEARTSSENMYERGGSNFNQVFEEFYDVKSLTVVFANDSLRLGDAGKTSINRFLSTFDRDTDVVSVVGCSHGRTSLIDGNKRLAIGRATRVAEALINAGVQQEKILNEGCWAPRPFDEVFPRRGVVLTLKREKRNG